MKYFLIAVIVVIVMACDTNDNANLSTSPAVQGLWVETGTRTDTLRFQSIDGTNLMTLSRGREFRSGHWLPKPRSGPYNYKLEGGKISLYWLLSSKSSFTDYNFRKEGDLIEVDNFFDSPSGPTLTFQRIH